MGSNSWRTGAVVFWRILLSLIYVSLSETKFHDWEVEYMYRSPDCFGPDQSIVMSINGQFPGQHITAKVGDTVIVNVTNKLHTEGVVIHWHGITMRGTPWADGTASISQCPINPGETFTYKFKVEKAGTYFYHGHYGMQRSAGLYGSLIVDVADGEKEPFHYDGEFNLLLSDWWHKSVHEQVVGLSSKPMRWIGEPQTLLINGRGQFNCSLAKKVASKFSIQECEFSGKEQCKHESFEVVPNKIYRVRIASTTALASLNVAIEGHKMTVVEADGNYVDPVEVENLDIHSGESYSVLIKTDQLDSKNYWISVGVRGREPKTPNALAILNYTGKSEFPTSGPPETPYWKDYQGMKEFSKSIKAKVGSPQPREADNHSRLILLNTQNYINGFTKWSINNVSLVLPPTPYLGSIKFGLDNAYDKTPPPDNYSNNYDIMKIPVNPNSTHGNGIYNFEFGSTVDVILQNANTLTADVSEIHPWHLHGHDFWVLGYAEGEFKKEDEEKFNLENPPLRNTAVLFPYGWTALRFVADNPGVWAFHCHIEPHLHMGMGVVFAEGVHRVAEIPKAALACGLTGSLQQPNVPLTPDSTEESLGPAPAPASGLSASLQVPNQQNSILIAIVLSLYLSFFRGS